MATARAERAPEAHTSTTGVALFLTTVGSLVSRSASGMLLAPPTWPAWYSALSQTSMTTAFSRLMSCTAAAGEMPAPPPPRTSGASSMLPETSATRISIQFANRKSTLFVLVGGSGSASAPRVFRHALGASAAGDSKMAGFGPRTAGYLPPSAMHKLVLIRHGESTWNLENRFTGWTDVDLTPTGIEQAIQAGRLLKAEGYDFDLAYTSVLTRAIRTLHLALDEMDRLWLPTVKHWRLNERHYGALQGLNKAETAKKYGDEQVLIWRRSYDTPPPALDASDARSERADPRYAKLNPEDVPLTECLKDTVARVLPFWNESMAPAISAGKRLVVSAHGNSIRALVKYLDHISDDDIVGLNIPNGIPLVYELDVSLKPIRSYYLGDAEAAARAAAAVASQGKG